MLTTIEAMNQAVKNAGGRISEEDFLYAVKELKEADGQETTIVSLKANAFNSTRMKKAGVMQSMPERCSM